MKFLASPRCRFFIRLMIGKEYSGTFSACEAVALMILVLHETKSIRKKEKMNSYPKYQALPHIVMDDRQWPSRRISKPPIWASVDLRDGNQSFAVPMNVERKREYFRMLVDVGFKEIEVAFPSASQDEYAFVRELIEGAMIPDDVRIAVFTQLRPHLIERTVESLHGINRAIVHCYIATSDLHANFVFGRGREQITAMAVEGVAMIAAAVEKHGLAGKIALQFSPEEFTDSDPDFMVALCARVKEAWGKCGKDGFIVNLPSTVERRPPYEYADMIEYFCRHYPYREETTVSVHSHNDQGCAIAAAEMAVLAGAERVEGVICGHGERTGNMDVMVFALNLEARGISSGLDFSRLPRIVEMVEECSGIPISQRHPYAGKLVFTAFSGSHQDAIRKGFARRGAIAEYFHQGWKMPYILLDPADIGRDHEGLIRINSQSGKGGVAFVLEHSHGIKVPDAVLPELGAAVQRVSDQRGGELSTDDVFQVFHDRFVATPGPFRMVSFSGDAAAEKAHVRVDVEVDGDMKSLAGSGNGPVDALVNALKQCPEIPAFALDDFSEKALGVGADARALAWVRITLSGSGRSVYGAGIHGNIDRAAVAAVFAALNRSV